MTDSPPLTAEDVIDRLSRAIDKIKPEPGMDGPHGGHRGPVTLTYAVQAMEDAIATLDATRAKASGEGLREYASCERTHATGTTHYHPLRVKADIDKYEDRKASGEGRAQGETGLLACPIDGQPASALFGNCGHSWSAALADPAPAGLDAERLISALNRLYLRSDKKWDAEPVRVFAEAIAAEYARLLPAPRTGEDWNEKVKWADAQSEESS